MRDNEIIPLPQELIFKIEKITARAMVNPRMIELSRIPEHETEAIIIQCVRKVCFIEGKPVIEHPSDWWQAVRERWFPAWAKRRWPVTYLRHEARAMFPQLDVPNTGQFVHYFTWFTEGPS